jgi:hypothetical protein
MKKHCAFSVLQCGLQTFVKLYYKIKHTSTSLKGKNKEQKDPVPYVLRAINYFIKYVTSYMNTTAASFGGQ